MSTPSAVTAIGAGHCIEFGTHEVFASCATMARPAKYPDLVYKV